MTEKIRLKDGTELNLIPMGITEKSNLRIFKFISDLDHEEIVSKFDEGNIADISYVLTDGTIGATYKDCVVLKSLTFAPNVQIDDNTVSDIYAVAISTDPIERGTQTLNAELVNIVDTIIMMSMPIM